MTNGHNGHDTPDEARLVTGDRSLNEAGQLDPTDQAMLEQARTGEGLIQLTPELLEELAQAAAATMAVFEDEVKALMTEERAGFVRSLRVDQGYSWRAVARACHEAWGGDWEPPSNQLMGMALCQAAAQVFDEDSSAPPWN